MMLDQYEAVFGTEAESKYRNSKKFREKFRFRNFCECTKFLYAPITTTKAERVFRLVKAKDLNAANILIESMQKLMFLRLI